jgi:hypothetical protein
MLLTGVAWCGACLDNGDRKTVHAGGAVRHYPMYRCSFRYGHVGRKAEPVDQWVSAYAIARLSRKDALELLSDHSRPEMAKLREAHKALTEQRTATLKELVKDLSAADFRVLNEEFTGQLAKLERQMEDAGRSSILRPLIKSGDVEGVWDSMPRDHQRRVIDTVFTVVLLPAGRGTRTFRPETVVVDPKRADPLDGWRNRK